MILYCENVRTFIQDCSGSFPSIGDKIEREFGQKHIGGGQESEYQSWIRSLPRMAEALKDERIPKDAYVGVEYKLIDTRQRVDFLIYGKDDQDKENVVLVELKQWSSARSSNLKNYVYANGGRGNDDYWHPSYQAFNYANIRKRFNEYVYKNKVGVEACSYLHNRPEGYQSLLKNPDVYPLVHQAPSFLSEDQEKLSSFIARYIKKSYKETLYRIDSSRIVPSEAFASMVKDAIKGTEFFSYDEQQAFSVQKIVKEVREAIDRNQRKTIIIKGGPGSGKSVVAINALGQLRHPDRKVGKKKPVNACYVTANFTPRSYFGSILTGKDGDFKKNAIKELFKTPAAFARCGRFDYDCILVDEAHRRPVWKFGWGISNDVDIVEKIFEASRVNVFLIDEDQRVTTKDYLTIDQIRNYARRYGSAVIEDDRRILSSQFRCVGGEQYIDFVNYFLGYTDSLPSLYGIRYDVKVLSSRKEREEEFNKKQEKGHDFRFLSGYTHEWVSEKNDALFDFVYPGGVKLKWNQKRADFPALLDDSQKKNVFCIHTIQGLEVEYAGVIIGKDLCYNEEKGRIEFHKENIARSDKASGIRTADDEDARHLIRNTYKVLLTRGVKGTYIFCEDEALNHHLKELLNQLKNN